ncbi:MAG: cysteine hydrolase [Betaproteobacteria bacterium]|nr:MAG: cysteine hydrolase [Betaproteobacteria bacterium]
MTTEPVMLETLRERVTPQHTALLIIDMQKDFCVEGMGASRRPGRDLSRTRAIIPDLVRLRQAARESGALVAHIGFLTLPNHLSDGGPWLSQRRRATYASDSFAMANSGGAEFISELSPQDGEVTIHKHRYSGFKGTDLDMILRAQDIRTCIVTGVSTNVCVESTLRDAFEHGYYVVVPGDGTASWSKELGEGTLQNVTHRFGLVTTVDEILAIWRSHGAFAPRAAA